MGLFHTIRTVSLRPASCYLTGRRQEAIRGALDRPEVTGFKYGLEPSDFDALVFPGGFDISESPGHFTISVFYQMTSSSSTKHSSTACFSANTSIASYHGRAASPAFPIVCRVEESYVPY